MTQIKYITPKFELEGSIAVIGSSVSILDQKLGEEIDSHENVIRFNRQPTKDWEDHVGSKTTARLVNVHVFQSRNVGRWEVDKDFVRRLADTKLILLDAIPELPGKRTEFIDDSIELFLFDNSKLRKHCVQLGIPDIGSRPSVGTSMLLSIILSSRRPIVYGWDVATDAPLSHYWEDRDNKSPCHNIDNERIALRLLQKKNLLEIR